MTDPWRCPDCGCLAVVWSKAHRRGCAYGVTPEHVLAATREVERLFDRVFGRPITEPTEDGSA